MHVRTLIQWAILALSLAAPRVSPAQCVDWVDGFRPPITDPAWSGVSGPIYAMAAWGTSTYVGGQFNNAGGIELHSIGRLVPAGVYPTGWDDVGGGLTLTGGTGVVQALCVHDDGTGPALFVGGHFDHAGSVAVHNIAKWNGSIWSDVGEGVSEGGETVYSLFSSSNVLYVGGSFASVGEIPNVFNIATWNGTQWSPMGLGLLAEFTIPPGTVYAITNGPNGIYAGGSFNYSSKTRLRGIARWTGSEWVDVSGGLQITGSDIPSALVPCYSMLFVPVSVNGVLAGLYVGGEFRYAGTVEVNSIARWDGSDWSALGAGLTQIQNELQFPGRCNAIVLHDDTSGAQLYAGGDFDRVNVVAINCIARWNGTAWSNLGDGITFGGSLPDTASVEALATIDPLLCFPPCKYIPLELGVGGIFLSAGSTASSNFAVWGDWRPEITAYTNEPIRFPDLGGSFTLTVRAIGTALPVTPPDTVAALRFQWYGPGGELHDGERATMPNEFATITGSQTDTAW